MLLTINHTKIYSKALITSLLTLVLSCPAVVTAGQDEPSVPVGSDIVDAGEITVTAARVNRLKKEVPVSIATVPEEAVQKQAAPAVLNALRDIPGVTVSDNGGNGLKFVRIRGEANRRTLILVDGQPVSQQKSMEGGMPFIGKSKIERVELVKGPASVLYGSEAIGGVVNIITKKGSDNPVNGRVGVTYDSGNNGITEDYSLSGSQNGFEYNLNYGKTDFGNRETTNGHLNENGYDAKDPGEKRRSGTESNSEEYGLYLGYKNDKIHTGARYDNFDMSYQVFSTAEPSAPFQDSTMDIPSSERQKYSAFFDIKGLTSNWKKLHVDGYHQKTKRDFDIWIDMYMDVFIPFPPPGAPMVIMDYTSKTRTYNEQVTNGGTAQMDWEFGDHYIVSGITYIQDDIDGTSKTRDRYGAVVPGSVAPYEHYVYDAEMESIAAFAQDEWAITEVLKVVGGIRYTDVSSDLNSTDDPDIIVQSGSSSDDNFAVSLGMILDLNAVTALRANYSQGYRHPNLVELYTGSPAHGSTPAKQGNTNLNPETSDSFELGVRYNQNGLNLDFAIFYTDATDYIGTDSTHYTNIGKAQTMGSELDMTYTISDTGFSPYVRLTWLEREYDYGSGSLVGTTKDSGVAEWSGRAGLTCLLDLQGAGFMDFDLFGRFASETKLVESDGTELSEGSWETMNFEITYTLDEGPGLWGDQYLSIEIFAAINNIFDQEYTPFDELEAPGRHYVMGMTASF